MSVSKNISSNEPTRAYRGAVAGVQNTSTRGADHWDKLNADTVLEAIVACSRICAGVLLGVTRDGGNTAVTLFFADDRVRFYPSDGEELNVLLIDIRKWAEGANPKLSFWR